MVLRTALLMKCGKKYKPILIYQIVLESNPKTRRYSYVKGNSKSRLDRIYISDCQIGKILKAKFSMTLWDDHKMFQLEISKELDHGPGQWFLNSNHLTDPNFKDLTVKELIFFYMLIFLLFSDQISGGNSLRGVNCLRGRSLPPPCGRKPENGQNSKSTKKNLKT